MDIHTKAKSLTFLLENSIILLKVGTHIRTKHGKVHADKQHFSIRSALLFVCLSRYGEIDTSDRNLSSTVPITTDRYESLFFEKGDIMNGAGSFILVRFSSIMNYIFQPLR